MRVAVEKAEHPPHGRDLAPPVHGGGDGDGGEKVGASEPVRVLPE